MENNLNNPKYRGKSVDFFYIEPLIFLLKNALNTFYNIYYDYWDLISKFWPASSNWKKNVTINSKLNFLLL